MRCTDPGDRLAFDVLIFALIYVLPGAVVVVSYALTGSRLLTGDQSLRRQLQPPTLSADHQQTTPRRWHCSATSDSLQRRHRHVSSASPVGYRPILLQCVPSLMQHVQPGSSTDTSISSDGVLEDMSLASRILEDNFYSPWPRG